MYLLIKGKELSQIPPSAIDVTNDKWVSNVGDYSKTLALQNSTALSLLLLNSFKI